MIFITHWIIVHYVLAREDYKHGTYPCHLYNQQEGHSLFHQRLAMSHLRRLWSLFGPEEMRLQSSKLYNFIIMSNRYETTTKGVQYH